MREITLDKYSDIKELCLDIQQSGGGGTYYRGTKTNSLLPSLITGTKDTNDEYGKVEEIMNDELKVKYGYLINEGNPILNDWELRVLGREHTLKNRLIDWSRNCYTPIDFSTYSDEDHPLPPDFVYLWVLSGERDFTVGQDEIRNRKFSETKEPFIYNRSLLWGKDGFRKDQRRQLIQGGSFLVQPTNTLMTPIEQNPLLTGRLVRIKIPVGCIETLRKDVSTVERINLLKSLMISDDPIDTFCDTLNKKHLS